ncbi:MAG: DEAD/DEAH box helicase [Bacillota bacterium]|nr:DEAD/DEAH box helicase [Bacillota bacterium]
MQDFLSLGISEPIVNLLKANGIVSPTPIQEQAIPPVMEGKDVIAQAQTGTGKTFTFVLPILEKIDPKAEHVQALIVTPTRELALQITNEIEKLLEHIEDIRVLAVYGGQDVEKQLRKLKKNVQIVVATPGRLLDHIRRETVQLSQTSFLVLDEADQMLHIGFLNEVEEIINATPTSRQTMLFSATMSDEIRKLASKHMRKPQNIQVQKKQTPAMTIRQIAIRTTDRAKQDSLIKLIETERPFLAVIFCRTKRRVSKLYEGLRAQGLQCDELHGDLSQAKREQVMNRFRDAKVQLLIATDVAARGLDVDGVTHVFNYDIPQDTESYIHRIGRTGRAGNEGLAVTLYSEKDLEALESIEHDLNIRIEKKDSDVQGSGKSSISSEADDSRNSDKRTDRVRAAKGGNRRGRPGENNGMRDRRGELVDRNDAKSRRFGKPGENRSESTGSGRDRSSRPSESRGTKPERFGRPGENAGSRPERGGRAGESRGPRPERFGRPGENAGSRPERAGRAGEGRGPRPERFGRPGENAGSRPERAGKAGEGRGPRPERFGRPGENAGSKPERAGRAARPENSSNRAGSSASSRRKKK